jgi:hypothetical protein
MAITTFDGLIARWAAGFGAQQPFWGELTATTTNNLLGSTTFAAQKIGSMLSMPALSSSYSSYIPLLASASDSTSQASMIIAKGINLGSLTLGDGAGAASTFADGAAMPTANEGNIFRQVASGVLAEVTTVASATPGSITITYINQGGTTGQVSTSQAVTANAVVGSAGLILLASGDTGVRDITTAARTAGTNPSGVLKFWGLIPLGFVPCSVFGGGYTYSRSLLLSYFNALRLNASDQLIFFFIGANAAKAVYGNVVFVADNGTTTSTTTSTSTSTTTT